MALGLEFIVYVIHSDANLSKIETMESIETHIQKDKEILQDPTISPQMRRHIEGELHDLETYAEHHKDDIEAGDHHDPTALELYCDANPSEPECLVYDD